jgi:hypothetical protein
MNAIQVNEIIECLNQSTGELWVQADNDYNGMTFTLLAKLDTLHFTDFKGRLHISGCINGLAKYMPYKAVRPSISADNRRTSTAIARDIQRRLLPEYRALLDTCAMRKLADDEYKAHKQALADKLCATGMARPLEWGSSDSIMLVDTDNIDGLDFKAQVNENSIRFEYLDLSADLALKVFAMLARESEQVTQ